MSYVTKQYDSERSRLKAQEQTVDIVNQLKTNKVNRERVQLQIQRDYRHKIVSIQSLLLMYEEEAYYTLPAYLHVVTQMQKKQSVNLPEEMYLMSFFENIGFFYENYTDGVKYVERADDALKKFMGSDNSNSVAATQTKIRETLEKYVNSPDQYKPYDPEVIENAYGPPENWEAFTQTPATNSFGTRKKKYKYKWCLLPDPTRQIVISHVKKGAKFLCAEIN
jgi:hypothetical protein